MGLPPPSPRRQPPAGPHTPRPIEVEDPPLTPGRPGRSSSPNPVVPAGGPSTALDPEHTRTFVEKHVKCPSCGYDLVGLRTDQNCPECGRAVSDARRARQARASAHITAAPEGWLRTFGIGGLAVIAGVSGLLSALPVNVFTEIWPEWLLLSSAVWWLGVVLTTLPRPPLKGMSVHPAREWFFLRIGAWLSQAAMVLGAGVLTAARHGTLDAVMRTPVQVGLGNGLVIAALLGLGFVFLLWSNLAFWASDLNLMHSLRICVWLGPVAALMAFGFVAATDQRTLAGQLLVLFGLTLVSAVPLGYVARTAFEFANVARWAIKNKMHAQEVEERLRERAMHNDD